MISKKDTAWKGTWDETDHITKIGRGEKKNKKARLRMISAMNKLEQDKRITLGSVLIIKQLILDAHAVGANIE